MTALAGDRPRLSIIVASRNDGHGGNIFKRMQLFVRGLLDQTRRYGLFGELIFVEWNPPADRPRLHEVLPTPSRDDCLTLRYITVPAAIHRRYRRATEIPLFQMIAKNVGIRRARGEFILCTNVDLLFSTPLIKRLAAPLSHDTYYRANRCDVPDGIDPEWDVSRQLAWCHGNVIRRLGRDPRYPNINLELFGMQGNNDAKKWLLDKLALGLRWCWSRDKWLFYQLDTFACGDFTLMSRAAWMAIEGYLELDLYSLHIDSFALIAAAALGYKQDVWPLDACTYHIDHQAGWEALSPAKKVRFLEERPAIDYSLVREAGLQALGEGKSFGLNAGNWGYADVELVEHTFPAASDGAAAFPAQVAYSGA